MSLELVDIFRDHLRPLSVQENTVSWFIVVTETESHKAGVSKFVFLTTPQWTIQLGTSFWWPPIKLNKKSVCFYFKIVILVRRTGIIWQYKRNDRTREQGGHMKDTTIGPKPCLPPKPFLLHQLKRGTYCLLLPYSLEGKEGEETRKKPQFLSLG